jgi:hypothetical protein
MLPGDFTVSEGHGHPLVTKNASVIFLPWCPFFVNFFITLQRMQVSSILS